MGALEAPELSPEDAGHLAGPLRIRDGELIVASDGSGRYRACRVLRRSPEPTAARPGQRTRSQRLVLEATGPVEEEPAARPAIVVAFSLPKQDRADWAVRMLTELGVDEIVPLLCERTVVRPEGEGGLRRHERLERISREAAMQSRRVRLPVLRRPEAIATMIGRAAHSLSLAEPGGGSLSLERPGVLVGPEGGWSDGELAAARNASVPQVALPGGVLRVETAAVAAGAVLAWLRQSGSPAAGRAAVSQG